MSITGRTPTREEVLSRLRRALADPDAAFRPGQWEAIRSLVEDRGRQIVVQRTGWGKSVIYFLATRLLRDEGRGVTLLISPLLAEPSSEYSTQCESQVVIPSSPA